MWLNWGFDNILHALRSKMVNVKMNFKSKYSDLSCPICLKHEDDQPHVLKCDVLNSRIISNEASRNKIEYDDIFKEVFKQKEITNLYQRLLSIRSEEENNNTSRQAAPSTSGGVLENNDNIPTSIVHYFSGKQKQKK